MKQFWKIVMLFLSKGGGKYLLLSILSGFFSFLFINLVTRIIGELIAGGLKEINKEYIIAFVLVILLFIWIRRTLAVAIINLSQKYFWQLRKEIIASVLNASYKQLNEKRVQINAAILNDVHILTDASINLITFSTSLILGIACLSYLAYLSWGLFFLTLFVSLIGIAIYYFSSRKNNKEFDQARKLENDFIENFNAVLNGFKEIFMEPRKGHFLYHKKISEIAVNAYKNNVTAFTGLLNNQIIGQTLFYSLICSVLLVFSVILNIGAKNIVSFVFTLLYLLGSIETVMVLLPGLLRARIASSHLISLRNELFDENVKSSIPERYFLKNEFEQLSTEGLVFDYKGKEPAFSIGPIDFVVNKGEVVFIYGGNGSGKTTFINNILGLIKPTSGQVLLNDRVITADQYPFYKSAFAVVFSDFYLFDGLIGFEHFSEERWAFYLELFEMKGKVKIENGLFSTTSLSTGQRKRLALIAALMEEKSILVIDEWAADQDPYFREKFYTEIIPILRNDGFTIIAVTHDDKYYHCADRLYKMDEGHLIEEHLNIATANSVN